MNKEEKIKIIERLGIEKEPICPKCNQEIEKLTAENIEKVWQDFYLDDDEEAEYDTNDSDIMETRYFCPLCNSLLFDKDKDEEEAISFLKGE